MAGTQHGGGPGVKFSLESIPPSNNFRDLSEPHRSTATHHWLSSELNREDDLCQTTSKVAWATAKYSSRRCQSYP